MSRFIDLTNKRFGRLFVVRQSGKNKYKNSKWLCSCCCGKKIIVYGFNLKRGHTKSCGCLSREGNNTKHSHSKVGKLSKIYTIWVSMKQRCNDPNHKSYFNYGGRGIIVCEEWLEFPNFLRDMGEVPVGYQIDRIDNNKGYYKENCRWVTPKQNNRNKRNNHLITYNDKTQTLIEWSEETKISKDIIRIRLKRGWSVERALTTPIRKRSK